MDDDVRAELSRLRARAYGPDADIHDDPVAEARLQELEDREREERSSTTAPPAVPVEAVPEPVGDADVVASAEPDDIDDAAPRWRRPFPRTRRGVWAWAVTVAVVAAAASSATAAGVNIVVVDRADGIAQVDALTRAPDVDAGSAVPLGIDPSQLVGFADYYGLTAFAGATQIDSVGNEAKCLFVVDTDDIVSDKSATGVRGGLRYGGCGAGPFSATVQFIVTPGLPETFRQRYPVGTAVQFVFDGTDVGVFADRG